MMEQRALAIEERDKLGKIARLPAGELRGWFAMITTGYHGQHRHPFPGEIAACRERERELGINLNEAPE